MVDFFQKIFRRTTRTRILFFIISDILLISLSVWLAFLLRFEGQIPPQYFPTIQTVIILALIFCLPTFYFLRLYSFTWSYVSTQELISLVKAVTLGFLFLGISLYFSKEHHLFLGFPRSTLFISYFLVILLCGGIRFSKRIYLQLFQEKTKEKKERTLIVGAGDAGEQILRNILISKYSSYFPIGFIDDSPATKGSSIHGLKVLGKINDIPKIVKEKRVESLIVALPSAGSKIIQKAVEQGLQAGIMDSDIKILPPMGELINGTIKVGMGALRQVEMEGLLNRELAVLDQKLVKNFIQNKKVLIAGAAGSIGSELCRQIAKFNPASLLILDQDETGIFNISEELKDKFPRLKTSPLIVNIRDEIKVKQIFKEFGPNIVFHAAAYKHVPLMEENSEEAIKNNVFGTKIIAEAAFKNRVEKFIFISTDKAVNPTSVMGATKRVGEMICQVLNQKKRPLKRIKGGLFSTKFISVRFGNILGSRGSVIPIFQKQIEEGGPIKITHKKMKRYFMTTPEACLLVMQAGAMGQGGEVFVLNMGNPVKIIDLAKELIKRSGFNLDQIKIKYVGPRPGEKFSEELLAAEEGIISTENQKIFIAKLLDVDIEKLTSGLKKLKEAVNKVDRDAIIKILKELVPFYQSTISLN